MLGHVGPQISQKDERIWTRFDWKTERKGEPDKKKENTEMHSLERQSEGEGEALGSISA